MHPFPAPIVSPEVCWSVRNRILVPTLANILPLGYQLIFWFSSETHRISGSTQSSLDTLYAQQYYRSSILVPRY